MGDPNILQEIDFSIKNFNINKNIKEKPLLLIFTPSSWLIPRPTYVKFREHFDKYFKYEKGFIITGNEFFKIKGRFPISFTIWSYNFNPKGNKNKIIIRDLTHLSNSNLDINWNMPLDFINNKMKYIIKNSKDIIFDNTRGDIRNLLPIINNFKTNTSIIQPRYNSYRNIQKDINGKVIISGFPRNDDRHTRIKDPHGYGDGTFTSFMDDNTPVRIKQDSCRRMSNNPDRIWFRLDNAFINLNQTRIISGPPDNRGFCAYDLSSAKTTLMWFALTKALNGVYPIWANQFDLWAPDFDKLELNEKKKNEFISYFYSLCFAFALSENRCVVTKFEADNPVIGAPEVFIDNPLCPANPDSFWATVLDSQIPQFKPDSKNLQSPAYSLVSSVKQLYKTWNLNYCKGQNLTNVGLQDEPYFKYFNYADFLTPYSGLTQIKKYTDKHNCPDLSELFKQISVITKSVKEEIYNLLIHQLKYFE